MDLKGQNEKMEGLVNFLEEEKIRLRDKMEKMMAAGEQLFGIRQMLKPIATAALHWRIIAVLLFPRQRPGAGVGDHACQTWCLWKGTLPVEAGCIRQESRGGEGLLSPGGRALQKSQRGR